jgi:SAM-dependent methyltransferase
MVFMEWFARDFDHPLYFEIYSDKEQEAAEEGAALAKLLDLPSGSLVLDLPCGWGRLRPALKERGYRVIGGDLSLLNLQKHIKEHPGEVLRLDLRALPIRNGCADGVFCAYTSWGYFATEGENLRQLQEFARVLKPGGTLLLDLVGRKHLERLTGFIENRWLDFPEGYRERVRWDASKRRITTDRIMNGVRFRHDLWIPGDCEIRTCLYAAGFQIQEAFGGLDGSPWTPEAERWIYRAIRAPDVKR